MPPPSTNLKVWLEADVGLYTDTGGTTLVASDGDLIALWKDQSGNGNDFIQATSGNRPVWKTNIVNGKPVGRFTQASSQSMATSGTVTLGIGTGDFWFCCVWQSLVAGSSATINTVLAIPNYTFEFILSGSTNKMDLSSSFTDHNFDTVTSNRVWYLSEIARVSSTLKAWISSGGAAPAQEATTFSSFTNNVANSALTLGADLLGDFRLGDIAELLLYNAALSSGDQATLENYLRSKYWGVGSGGLIRPVAMDGLGGTYKRDIL